MEDGNVPGSDAMDHIKIDRYEEVRQRMAAIDAAGITTAARLESEPPWAGDAGPLVVGWPCDRGEAVPVVLAYTTDAAVAAIGDARERPLVRWVVDGPAQDPRGWTLQGDVRIGETRFRLVIPVERFDSLLLPLLSESGELDLRIKSLLPAAALFDANGVVVRLPIDRLFAAAAWQALCEARGRVTRIAQPVHGRWDVEEWLRIPKAWD